MPVAGLVGLSAAIGAPQLAREVRAFPSGNKQAADALATWCEGFHVGIRGMSFLCQRQAVRPFVEALIADLNTLLDQTPASPDDVKARLSAARTASSESRPSFSLDAQRRCTAT